MDNIYRSYDALILKHLCLVRCLFTKLLDYVDVIQEKAGSLTMRQQNFEQIKINNK